MDKTKSINLSDNFTEGLSTENPRILSSISDDGSYDIYTLYLNKTSLSELKKELRKANIDKEREYSDDTINGAKILKHLKKGAKLFKSDDSAMFIELKKIINYFEMKIISDNMIMFDQEIKTKMLGSNYDESDNKMIDGFIIGVSPKRNLVVRDENGIEHEIETSNKNIVVNTEKVNSDKTITIKSVSIKSVSDKSVSEKFL